MNSSSPTIGNASAAGFAVAADSGKPQLGPFQSLRAHRAEYGIEAGLLATFMVSACVFGTIYEHPQSPIHLLIPSMLVRRFLMGLSMGTTATALIYSPWGKQSGAHLNPAVTLTFLWLGKIKLWDATFYAAAQFAGAIAGVEFVSLFLRQQISHRAVRYVVTTPGSYGPMAAFCAEAVIAFGMMSMVLRVSNHPTFNRLTGLFAGLLVATYITVEAPFSGMSMNPARTLGSAFPAAIWTSLWIYFSAPLLGMFSAAELYIRTRGKHAVLCCKLDHFTTKRCIFCGANGGFAS